MILDNRTFTLNIPVNILQDDSQRTFVIEQNGVVHYAEPPQDVGLHSIPFSGTLTTSELSNQDVILAGYFQFENTIGHAISILPFSLKIVNTTELTALRDINNFINSEHSIKSSVKVVEWTDIGKSAVMGINDFDVILEIRGDGIYIINPKPLDISNGTYQCAYGTIHCIYERYGFVLDRSVLDGEDLLG